MIIETRDSCFVRGDTVLKRLHTAEVHKRRICIAAMAPA